MPNVEYQYSKSGVALDSLEQEIRTSSIITALRYINLLGSNDISIVMADTLTQDDIDTLSTIVNTHLGIPLEQEPQIVSIYGPKDSDGVAISRTKVTQSGWRYDPRALDWVTSKSGSLYNRKPTGFSISTQTDIGDAYLKFFDSSGTQLVQGQNETDNDYQDRLAIHCTCTHMDWQPTYNMDIIGAAISKRDGALEDCYMWAIIAPDIPEIYGGSLRFGDGGWNLSHLSKGDSIRIDGRGSKTINYDSVYNSNKFRMKIVHPPGELISMQIFFEHYHA